MAHARPTSGISKNIWGTVYWRDKALKTGECGLWALLSSNYTTAWKANHRVEHFNKIYSLTRLVLSPFPILLYNKHWLTVGVSHFHPLKKVGLPMCNLFRMADYNLKSKSWLVQINLRFPGTDPIAAAIAKNCHLNCISSCCFEEKYFT